MPTEERNDFEAFLEASIVFARAALHRFKTQHEGHPGWKQWWDSLLTEPSALFFRNERDFILKEGPPRVGQNIFMPFIGPDGTSAPAFRPEKAADLYYFDDPQVAATDTVRQHLDAVERIVTDAQRQFASTP
jgi:hypothetical protein